MSNEVEKVPLNMTTEQWLCIACKFLLGYVENKTIVRMKRKDFYVTISGESKIEHPCPRCGKVNVLEDIPEEINKKGGN